VRYIASANPETFQPMNIHFGLLPPLDTSVHPKKARRAAMIARALADLQEWQRSVAL
jgi:methylenetetrahydrofolate--tRNA-(uracil-5-)-methyltransferase